jgi:C-terminal processing protease CtpA/Prc
MPLPAARPDFRAITLALALAGSVFAAPAHGQTQAQAQAEPPEPASEEVAGSPLSSGLDAIEKQFITPIPRDQLETKALAALLKSLDPYSHYLEAGQIASFRSDTLAPAATAAPSVRALRRDGSESGSPDWWLDRERRLGYLRIAGIAADTATRVDTAVRALKHDKARGLVLDLRDCPGGLVQVAVETADLFVARGRLLTIRQRDTEQVFDARRGKYTKLPLAILINARTASSCEILAGALADNGRGTLVGERTYGKGRIQTVYTLGEGRGGMVMSTGTFQRPNGKTIDKHDVPEGSTDAGITPQVEVKMSKAEHAAWRAYAQRSAGAQSPAPAERDSAPPDPVLAKAIELLAPRR